MNDGVIGTVFSLVYVSLKEFGVVGSDMGYKRFSQMLVGVLGLEETLPWARQGNKLHSTICIVLLSEFVSQNTWLPYIYSLSDSFSL